MIGRSIPKNLMPNIYNALVTSHLYYCISVWGGNSSQLEPLFTAQKKSLRSLFRLKRARKHHDNWIYGHTKKHFNANNFLSVHNIYTYSTIIETFKILKTQEPKSVYNELFSISNINELRLNPPRVRLNTYFKNFNYMSPLLWNTTINSNVINSFSTTLNYFKKQLKLYLMSMQKQFDADSWHPYNTDFLAFITYQNKS